MKKFPIHAMLICGELLSAGCAGGEEKIARQGNLDKELSMGRDSELTLDYLLYVPEDYESRKAEWPLLVFLHGVGERGEDLEALRGFGPPKLIEEGKDLPFIVAAPLCPAGKYWNGLGTHLVALVDELVEEYNVDERRVYLTGLSMGGYGVWALASIYPERFAAIVPICGGGQPYMAPNLKNVPVWAFHGEKDEVVPLKESQQMVDAVNRAGGNAKLTVYPGVGHDSWTQTYENPAVYEWLLGHEKPVG